MTHTEPTPSDLLRRLAVAGWGVCVGVLIATIATAVLIAIRGDTQVTQHPELLPSVYLDGFEVIPWQERYEHTWYALVCSAGALCGWVAVRFARLSPWLAMPTALAFIPLAAWACRGIFAANPSVERLLACAGVLALPLLWRIRSASDELVDELQTAVPVVPNSSKRMWVTAAILCVPLAGLLYALLGPHKVSTVASECNTELHVASYIVGPALYYRAPGVVPGLDFESHYGVGHAYAFSRVMGSSGGLQKTLERFVLFTITVTIFYFLSALLVLTDWFKNPWIALAVTLMLVLTSCAGMAYNYASNWPVRHPFLFAFLFAAVRGVNCRWWCVAAGGVAGLSLFWQTDTGLYTLAAGVAFYSANCLFLGGSVWRPFVFLATALGSFFALCTVLYGPRVLSVTFAERLLEPLLLYANGFGTYLMNWAPGWGYWYNLLGPGLAIGSVAVLIGYGRRGTRPSRAVLYGAAASLLGLAMLFKWVNRSIDIIWGLNGGLVVAVAGWWLWLGWQALTSRLGSETRPLVGFARQAAVAGTLLALLVVWTLQEVRAANGGTSKHPIVQAITWMDNFRNPINAARKGIDKKLIPPPIDPAGTKYLRANTRRSERVAIICGADWNYLADAGRAPRLHWLQLFLVHSPVLLDRCAEDVRTADRVFVDRDALASLKGINPAAHAKIAPILEERFELSDASSARWRLYSRKPGATAGR